MTSQIKGMQQAVRNANDGISLAQTADSALGEITNLVQRVRELAVQSASGTLSNNDRESIQLEATELLKQVNDIAGNTRSEERRVGKECVSTCRSRWSTSH